MMPQRKAAILRKVIELLQDADELQQVAIGKDTDVSYEYHSRIQDLVEDLSYDVMELEGEIA